MITDPTTRDSAMDAISSAHLRNLGVRDQARVSADLSKPRNVAAVFVSGGQYEIHASRTLGRFKNWVWVYQRGVLQHEGPEPSICSLVCEIAERLHGTRSPTA